MQLIIFLLGVSIILLVRNTKKKILYRTINKSYTSKVVSTFEVPYLIRYTIFKCKYFSVKIHKALMSDPAELHDHPWSYVSIILWGGYWETTPTSCGTVEHGNRQIGVTCYKKKWYRPGSVLIRKGDKPHKLVIPKGKFSISLIFVGRRYREWGYLDHNSKPVASKEIKSTLKELTKKETSWLTPHIIRKEDLDSGT